MKRTPLKRRAKKQKKVRKVVNKGYKPPKWFNKIPLGSHGQTPAQKRYWWVVSQTYREQDYKKYGPNCPGCGQHIPDWKYGHLGHWLRYSLCNSLMKWERKNLLLICPGCNYKDDAITLRRMGEELQRRHGDNVLTWIENSNLGFRGRKIELWEIVENVAKLRPDLVYD